MTNSETLRDDQNLILDTHVLLWYAEGIRLSNRQVDIIEENRKNNKLYISAISVWEVAMLASKGRFVVTSPIKDWIEELINRSAINLLELSSDILIESSFLPNYEYKDPADRLIIASVRSTDSQLMTFDQKIIDYANLGYLQLVDNI